MLRSIECGIKALALDLGKIYDTQQWNSILGEIESEIAHIRRNGIHRVAKPEKDERLEFLSQAALQIGYFKDGWRNYVSHNKRSYDVIEAKSVYNHCESFLSILSLKLSE
jgi:hypothetical protein